MKLTAMTYNICSGRNLARQLDLAYAASVIREVQPDFVTLNEVRSRTEDVGPIDQANELGRLTGYYPVFGRSIDHAGGEYGNALLTRLPLVECGVVHIPDPERTVEGGYYEHRTLLRAVLMAGERRITVLCTHFGLVADEQRNAVNTALELLTADDMPKLLMGDLNMEPGDPILAPLLDAMHDTAHRCAQPLTFPSDKPNIKIDYILHTDGLRALSLRSMDTQCSDHRPLIAELELD